jgi:putative DNA-binding protein
MRQSAEQFADLASVQAAIQRSVLDGNRAAREHVVGTRQVSITKRLQIYREAYYVRLAEALATTYPALHALLGEDQSRVLARSYIDAHPSRHYSLRYFGHRLARFLERHEPYRSTPLLTDLARWEWAAAAVFDAPDTTAMTADALTHIAPDSWPLLRFEFHTAVRLMSSRWNVAEIWSRLTREQSPPRPLQARRVSRWAIWRTEGGVFYAPTQLREELALRAAFRGEPFAYICTWVAGEEASAALWAASLLRQWIERGWIVRIEAARSCT